MEAGQLKRTDEDIEYIKEKLMPLIVDGYDRAQQIPSEARIQRLAEVVVSGLWSRHSEDERREIMRIVGDVDELDAVLLGHLYRRRRELEQGSGVAGTGINVKYFVSTGVVTDGDVANSGLLKLQSLGLVIAQSNGFRLLTRGKTFLILTGLVQPEEDA
jgi:hypothetical protein